MRMMLGVRRRMVDYKTAVIAASDRLRQPGRPNAVALVVVAALFVPGSISTSHAADGEIRIGNTMPYSGPASAYGVIGKTITAFFRKINAEGGIRGRRINFISYDDAYNPQKTVEATRKLVEDDRVLFMFASLGTAPGAAVRPYLNANKIPQLFVASGASTWDRPSEFPWTMGFQPSYQTEAHIYAQYLLETHPSGGKIAILYQDDEFGKDYVKGLMDGLGGKIPIVAEAAYKITDANINQQVAKLKSSGADIFFDVTTPKFAVMAIRRAAELGWKPEHIISTVSNRSPPSCNRRGWKMRKAFYRLDTSGKETIRPPPAIRRIASGPPSWIGICPTSADPTASLCSAIRSPT